MIRRVPLLIGLLVLCAAAGAQRPDSSSTRDPASVQGLTAAEDAAPLWGKLRAAVERHLGKPYAWGAVGMRSFDCSGFVWRVMCESGIMVKRTTARKFYMMLPKVAAGEERRPGNIVFFNRTKHCGIVKDDRGFYHAAVRKGTCYAPFTPAWSAKICGYRAVPPPGTSE